MFHVVFSHNDLFSLCLKPTETNDFKIEYFWIHFDLFIAIIVPFILVRSLI